MIAPSYSLGELAQLMSSLGVSCRCTSGYSRRQYDSPSLWASSDRTICSILVLVMFQIRYISPAYIVFPENDYVLQQVELNTISCAFPANATATSNMHRYRTQPTIVLKSLDLSHKRSVRSATPSTLSPRTPRSRRQCAHSIRPGSSTAIRSALISWTLDTAYVTLQCCCPIGC